ncbi:MAG TPA: DNA alkylation repair protein [Bryobacteraceae bacterium]|nr:DNA alkylation repair protein [Bryobacteraceae bacterium]
MAQKSALIRALRRALRESADPLKAPGMQAYMKSTMPYLGVQTGPLRKVTKAVFAAHPLASFADWRDTVLELWRKARYREERYAAIELAGNKRYREFQTLDALAMYEELITSGAWWDYVDTIASHQIGELLRQYPAGMKPLLRQWACCENMWKRRSAILAQLQFKRDTDLELLYDCLEPSLASSEFFLRKGIGWALRQYAWTDPREVQRYVRQYEARLSPLTRREALKNVGPHSSKSR